ncbi:MAG: hypothetical protein HC921_06890 [Synechococcaceae cyanobacterium SM2_3_1]|nr:hypothetical protein [Synechococcaceae cyanobacterium SM2_3_1]
MNEYGPKPGSSGQFGSFWRFIWRLLSRIRWGKTAQRKIDINTCSKHEMVYRLGLPIVYANDIERLRHEGYQLTSIEDLWEIVGIPEPTARRIEPLLVFRYSMQGEATGSWRRLNTYSVSELIACGIEDALANRIVEEREQQGPYRSPVDARRRVGLDLHRYQRLL